MTNKNSSLLDMEPSDAAGIVAEYLLSHRDFFLEHEDMLALLTIPHPSGAAASLIEKQVQVLRERHEQLEDKYHEVLTNAHQSELLSQQLHTLTMQLLGADSSDEVLTVLELRLLQDFNAEHTIIRLFVDPPVNVATACRVAYAGSDCAARKLFNLVFATGRPECGRLEPEQEAFLFGAERSKYGSAVLVPLLGKQWEGLLAVGSADPRRYYAGMGVDLMVHLGDIASLALNPHMSGTAE